MQSCSQLANDVFFRGDSRYKFTHEILDDKVSHFRGQHVPRDRRISVICRNEPPEEDNEKTN